MGLRSSGITEYIVNLIGLEAGNGKEIKVKVLADKETAKSDITFNLPVICRGPGLISREDMVAKISTVTTPVQVLYGARGTGKTVLAMMALARMSKDIQNQFLIQASSRAELSAEMVSFARAHITSVNMDTSAEDAEVAAKEFFANNSWVLVADNATAVDDVLDLFPIGKESKNCIIITMVDIPCQNSRDSRVASSVHEIKCFTPEESMQLMANAEHMSMTIARSLITNEDGSIHDSKRLAV